MYQDDQHQQNHHHHHHNHQKHELAKNVILTGIICGLIVIGISLTHLIMDVLYFVKLTSVCESSSDSSCVGSHLLEQQGLNYYLFVAPLDLILFIFGIVLVVKIKNSSLSDCSQYGYITVLLLSLIANILSSIQQSKYVDDSSVLLCEQSKYSDTSLCSFVSVQQAYKTCLIPFPIVQIVFAIGFKIYYNQAGKAEQQRRQKEFRNKQIEESSLNLPMFNSKGRPFTVRELYNLGKS